MEYSIIVSPEGPNPCICFILPYREAIPAARIKRVGCISVILKFQARMYKNIVTQTLRNPLHKAKRVEVDVLRLDLIHPVISGNKWFKLKHHIEAALQQKCTGLFSFGGAYS